MPRWLMQLVSAMAVAVKSLTVGEVAQEAPMMMKQVTDALVPEKVPEQDGWQKNDLNAEALRHEAQAP